MENETKIDIQDRVSNIGVHIIKFVDKLPRTLSATELGKQLLRSGTSVAANFVRHFAQGPLNTRSAQALIIEN